MEVYAAGFEADPGRGFQGRAARAVREPPSAALVPLVLRPHPRPRIVIDSLHSVILPVLSFLSLESNLLGVSCEERDSYRSRAESPRRGIRVSGSGKRFPVPDTRTGAGSRHRDGERPFAAIVRVATTDAAGCSERHRCGGSAVREVGRLSLTGSRVRRASEGYDEKVTPDGVLSRPARSGARSPDRQTNNHRNELKWIDRLEGIYEDRHRVPGD